MACRKGVCLCFGILAVVGFGCRRQPEAAEDANRVSAGQVGQKASEAAQTTGDYLRQQGEQAVSVGERKLSELQENFQQWRAKASAAGEGGEQKLQTLEDNVTQKLTHARQVLKEQGQGTWKETKGTVDRAVQSTQEAYDAFVDYVKSHVQDANQP